MVYLSFITAVPLFFFDLDHRVTWLLKILVLNRKSFRPSPPHFLEWVRGSSVSAGATANQCLETSY